MVGGWCRGKTSKRSEQTRAPFEWQQIVFENKVRVIASQPSPWLLRPGTHQPRSSSHPTFFPTSRTSSPPLPSPPAVVANARHVRGLARSLEGNYGHPPAEESLSTPCPLWNSSRGFRGHVMRRGIRGRKLDAVDGGWKRARCARPWRDHRLGIDYTLFGDEFQVYKKFSEEVLFKTRSLVFYRKFTTMERCEILNVVWIFFRYF